MIALAITIVLGIALRGSTKVSRPPTGWLALAFLFVAFALSIVWIWFTADILIDILNLFGILSGINPSLLGLTILAWGNSSGDLMANLSIAKKGFSEMAMTGCYAGPLFNALIGLGLTTLRINMKP